MEATHEAEESIVGDECHIVSARENGPRYDPEYLPDQIDGYQNLVLLCRVHHKHVDDQAETFTPQNLRQLKENHERWVSESLDDASVPLDKPATSPASIAFRKVQVSMPDLIQEMREDLDANEFVREFFLVSKKWVMNPGRTERFAYYYEQHENLDGKVQVLENHGFVYDVTPGNTKVYRMTEEFVELLTAS